MVSNRSFASQLKFGIQINRIPNVNFMIQTANIPGLAIGRAGEGSPFTRIMYQGDHIDWGTFDVSFKVDENFDNWYEIHSWIIGQGFPRKFKEYADFKQSKQKDLNGNQVVPKQQKETHRKVGDIYSQITLLVSTSHNNPIIEFQFADAFPIAISPLELSTKDNDVDYLTCTTTFSYTYFTVSRP